jgi:hypothetical protein
MMKFVLIGFTLLCFTLYLIARIFLPQFDLFETFFSETVGAAIGGAIGALIVFILREKYIEWIKKPERINTYYISDNKEEIYGKLIHQRGRRISEASEIKRILGDKVEQEVLSRGIWEWGPEEVAENPFKGTCAFYGPYAYDLTEPGTYEVWYYYFGREFTTNYTQSMNKMLMHFEILLKNNEGQKTKCKKYLYYEHFTEEGESTIGRVQKLRFYYDGNGEIEYKAFPPGEPKDTVKILESLYNSGSRIYFFKVEIYRIYDLQVPSA